MTIYLRNNTNTIAHHHITVVALVLLHLSLSSLCPFSRKTEPIMSIIDEETRRMILRKTWCHGQSILPLYSVVLLAWWWHIEEGGGRPLRLVFASIVLPIWAWYSYK